MYSTRCEKVCLCVVCVCVVVPSILIKKNIKAASKYVSYPLRKGLFMCGVCVCVCVVPSILTKQTIKNCFEVCIVVLYPLRKIVCMYLCVLSSHSFWTAALGICGRVHQPWVGFATQEGGSSQDNTFFF